MKQAKLVQLLEKYTEEYKLQFNTADTYYWSAKEQTVFYQNNDASVVGLWTLLHEASHGILNHKTYNSDFELVTLEVAAWEKARKLGQELKIKIEDDHIQDCLDSYRDWQYKRSLCPNCSLGGIQINVRTYQCLFCDNMWRVSAARFCRPYRRKSRQY